MLSGPPAPPRLNRPASFTRTAHAISLTPVVLPAAPPPRECTRTAQHPQAPIPPLRQARKPPPHEYHSSTRAQRHKQHNSSSRLSSRKSFSATIRLALTAPCAPACLHYPNHLRCPARPPPPRLNRPASPRVHNKLTTSHVTTTSRRLGPVRPTPSTTARTVKPSSPSRARHAQPLHNQGVSRRHARHHHRPHHPSRLDILEQAPASLRGRQPQNLPPPRSQQDPRLQRRGQPRHLRRRLLSRLLPHKRDHTLPSSPPQTTYIRLRSRQDCAQALTPTQRASSLSSPTPPHTGSASRTSLLPPGQPPMMPPTGSPIDRVNGPAPTTSLRPYTPPCTHTPVPGGAHPPPLPTRLPPPPLA